MIGLQRVRWFHLLLAGLVVAAAVAGSTMGYFLRFDLPDIRALEDYNPPEMTRVLAKDGEEIGTFAEERRILIDFGQIPQPFLEALIATEDSSFYRHTGIDFKGIVRALWRDVTSLSMAQGASTLTQQLARNLFLHPDKTIRRKVQEAFLALQIERHYSKQEILRFYCNQIYTGHGRWGLEAASRFYFGKPAQLLGLPEAAMMAGLIQRPEALSPKKNPARALARRNFVLSRMVEEGYLTREAAAVAQGTPIVVAAFQRNESPAPYFIEEVRRWIQQRHGSSRLYKEGLEVRTTLDPLLQKFANEAMDLGLRQLDRRQGWRGVAQRLAPEDDSASWSSPGWEPVVEVGRVYDGVVMAVTTTSATVRVGRHLGPLGKDAIRWTGESRPDRLLTAGDLIRVRLVALAEDGTASFTLEQEPLVEAALIVLEPATGAVRALVGGFDFERSEFDRAIQAQRQTGSAFKPLIYVAALDRGWTLADTLLDEPTVFIDPRREPYQPENYTHEYYETVTLRTALEKSANISTVKLLDAVGYTPVIETSRRLGIRGEMQPYPSLALGVFGSSLLELTAAYGAFANQGVLVEPHMVEEVRRSDDIVLDEIEPEVRDAVSPQVAYLMNRVLSGVISDGTGRAAASLGHGLAGKTGTTDNNTDAWFIGYSRRLAVGVWVGFDEPKSLGSRETGALAALPIWRTFMERALEGQPDAGFETPVGISFVSIDRHTGLRANAAAGCSDTLTEAFISRTEPTGYCTRQHHDLLTLPYPFQRYELNARGELEIPRDELEPLLESELEAFLVRDGAAVEIYTKTGIVTLPIHLLPPDPARTLPDRIREEFDTSRWVGKDGRLANVIWLNQPQDRSRPALNRGG